MTTELFKKRLSAFYSTWRIHTHLWGNSDIIVFSTPAQAASNLTGDFFVWLFGEDLAGTTAVFTLSSIFFLCTQESFSRLRSLGSYATEVLKIPVSVELNPRRRFSGPRILSSYPTEVTRIPVSVELKPEEGLSKLDEIIRRLRLRLKSGKSIDDPTCTLTVGCIDKEIPKSKLLMSCVNDFECFAKYRISTVNNAVRMVMVQTTASESRIYKNDNLLADNMQFNRGVKRTMEDRIENPDLIKGFKEMNVSLGEAETSSKVNTDKEMMILENLGWKFEKPANELPLVVDQRKTTEPMMEGETSFVPFRLEKEKGVGMQMQMQCYNESREFKQPETEKDGARKDKKAARKGLSVPEQRLTLFYSSWRKYRNELWGGSDVLVVTTPPSSSSGSMAAMLDRPVSSSFFLWLLGRDFPNTTAVFMDRAIYFSCPIESYAKLCLLGLYMTKAAQVSVSVQQKVKAGDESELLNSTLDAFWTDRANDHPVVIGYINGEAPSSKLDEGMFQATNVMRGFLKLLCEEGDGLKSLQIRSLDTTEDKDIENLAENYQQVMSLLSNDAKASRMVSNEQQKDELLQEKHENKDELHKSEETNQLQQENNGKIGNLPSKFAEMNIVVEGEQCPHSTEEDGSESKLLVAEEGNSPRNAEPVVLAENEQESQSGNVRVDASIFKESVGSDDDWEIVESSHEGQQLNIANNSSWGSWIGRAFSSVSLHHKAAGDESSS
nr:fact complex subunit spt16 [Ipomoea batatas]